jgi:hypothetical protein
MDVAAFGPSSAPSYTRSWSDLSIARTRDEGVAHSFPVTTAPK